MSASIVGSGEIILTAASARRSASECSGGCFVVLEQVYCPAELTRYVVVGGDTYIRALNRIPGRLPGPKGPVAWPVSLDCLYPWTHWPWG